MKAKLAIILLITLALIISLIVCEKGKDNKMCNNEQEIGLIITDMNMPVMNGIEFIKKLKKSIEFQEIPIIALTTNEEKGDASLSFGASGFIMKSSNTAQEIIRFINMYLKKEEINQFMTVDENHNIENRNDKIKKEHC